MFLYHMMYIFWSARDSPVFQLLFFQHLIAFIVSLLQLCRHSAESEKTVTVLGHKSLWYKYVLIHCTKCTTEVRSRVFPPKWIITVYNRSQCLMSQFRCYRVGKTCQSKPPLSIQISHPHVMMYSLLSCRLLQPGDPGISQNPHVGSTHISFPSVVKVAALSVSNFCSVYLWKHNINLH